MKKMYDVLLFLVILITPAIVFAGNGEEMTKLLGVQLGNDTTLLDVTKRLGTSRIIETGEAGEYKATVCYYVQKCKTKVEFWSSEMGGDKHEVIGFTLTRTENNEGACPPVKTSCEDIQTSNGMHLGMKKGEFTRKLRGKVKQVDGFYQKGFESRKPTTEKDRRRIGAPSDSSLMWDIVIFVRGAFSRGGLDILEISRTQTL